MERSKEEPNTSCKAKGIHTQQKWKHNQFLNSNLNEKQSSLTEWHRPSTSSSAAAWFQEDTCTDLHYFVLMSIGIKNTNHRQSHRAPRWTGFALPATQGEHSWRSQPAGSDCQWATVAATSAGNHRASCWCSKPCRRKAKHSVIKGHAFHPEEQF